jgi:hypothetical protein
MRTQTIMRKIFTLILILSITIVNAQNTKKGFKSLEKAVKLYEVVNNKTSNQKDKEDSKISADKEYDKARESFQKNLVENKDNIAANFGLALILADDQSALFNIIDSWQYVERIQDKIDKLPQEDMDIIGEYFYNTEAHHSNRPVKKKIEIALEAIEDRLIKYIREENNLDAVYEVLQRYPNFRFYNNVVHIRDQFEYRKYEKLNTIEAYETFIQKFPQAAQVEKAEKSRNKLAFANAKSINTEGAYLSYIAKYPESEDLQAAIKLRNAAAFSAAKKINTLESYDKFINSYPDALEVADAKGLQQDLLYAQAKRIKSIEAFNDFIKRYPEGKYFVDIFNLKATELGTKFLHENSFDSPSITWAKAFDNNGSIETGGAMAITPEGEYVVACNTRETDTSYANVWVLKLDANGKMIWNKVIGQAYEDSLSSVLIDTSGNIIIVGYTHLSTDSASKMGWVFKLGPDGKKIWNRNIGKFDIKSCAIDNSNRIYIGGSLSEDSLKNHCALTIFNDEAKIQWQRVYTGFGSINDVKINGKGNILMAGSHWVALTDPKRYLIYEDTIKSSLEGLKCALLDDGSSYYTGAGKGAVFYSRYNPSGKKAWMQEYPKTDSSQFIRDIALTDNKLILLEQKSTGGKIKLMTADGKIPGVKDIFGNNHLEKVVSDARGLVLLIDNGDLIVLRMSSPVTL